MEYFAVIIIVSVIFACVGIYRQGYNKACQDLIVESHKINQQFKTLAEEGAILKEHQKRAGLDVRPTLSVVTQIKSLRK